MKKQFLLTRMLLLCALIIGSVSSVWGQTKTSTLTFEAKCNGSGTADDDVAWTVTSDGTESSFDNTKGIHYGTNSAAVKYIQLSTSGISGTITKIVVNASTASGVSATASVTVGGSAFGGDPQSLSTTATDYTFTGSASGEIVVTVTKPSSAAKALYVKSVTITYTTNATKYTLSSSVAPASAGSVELGSTSIINGGMTTITAKPNSGYRFVNWEVTGTGASVSDDKSASTTFTMGSEDATVTAHFELIPTYTVTFSVNGIKSSNQYKENVAIVFPSNPSDIAGKVFVGWSESQIVGTTDTKPKFVSSATAKSNITYYAVFATIIPGDATNVIDAITQTTTEVTGTSYTDFSGKTGTSGAVYAGQCAGGNESVQLRSKNSDSGVISTTSGGKVTKVAVVWNDNTASERTLNVYGSNTAYSAATDLYNNTKQGTLLGTIVYGTSTELDITGDYAYVGLRSEEGAMYLNSISITWQTGTPDTYSEFATTIPSTEDATISAAGYATYVGDHDLDFSGVPGLKAYRAVVSGSVVRFYEVEQVPAGEGVLLKGAAGYYEVPTMTGAASITNDFIRGTGVKVASETDGKYNYILNNVGGVVGFYAAANNVVATNHAYLQTTGVATTRLSMIFDDEAETTGISDIKAVSPNTNNVYNLRGQRVAQPVKGLYIVNGKIIIIK